jgi:hypothetical protein
VGRSPASWQWNPDRSEVGGEIGVGDVVDPLGPKPNASVTTAVMDPSSGFGAAASSGL